MGTNINAPSSPRGPYKKSIPSVTQAITGFDALPNSAFVREFQLVRSPKRANDPVPLPFSGPTLWRMVKTGAFPKPTKFSERVTAWNVGEVRDWLAARRDACCPGSDTRKRKTPPASKRVDDLTQELRLVEEQP